VVGVRGSEECSGLFVEPESEEQGSSSVIVHRADSRTLEVGRATYPKRPQKSRVGNHSAKMTFQRAFAMIATRTRRAPSGHFEPKLSFITATGNHSRQGKAEPLAIARARHGAYTLSTCNIPLLQPRGELPGCHCSLVAAPLRRLRLPQLLHQTLI